MNIARYTRRRDNTFKKEGTVKERYVYLRIFKDGFWKEGTVPLLRTRISEIIEKGDFKYLPAEIYELVGIESKLTEEDRERLKQISEKKKGVHLNDE